MGDKSTVFPLFLNLENKNVLVVGSGKIASRRIKSLLSCRCNITVVSTGTLDEDIKRQVEFIENHFCKEYLENQFIVLATTNDKDLNREIYKLCKERNVLVNVCDDRSLCDFYFPAIFENEDIIGGVTSKNGNAHALVKETASKIRGVL